jgi:tetratricopeptide (TPR) repeat protein
MKKIVSFLLLLCFYEVVLAQDPEAKAFFNKGEAKFADKDYKGAIEEYTKAIARDPDYVLAYNNRGAAKSWLNQKEEAIADYTKAIKLDPDFSRAYQNRADDLTHLKRYKEAYDDYSKCIEYYPEDASLYNYRGNCMFNQGVYKESIADYTKAIKLNPKHFWAYYNRGKARYNLMQYLEAVSDFTNAISIDPTYVETYNERGNTKFGLRDYQGAIPDYDKYISMNPKASQVYANRGFAKNYLKQYKQALPDLKQAVEIDPENATAWCWLAEIEIGLKDFSAALKDVEKAISLSAEYPRAYLNRARIKQETADKYDALNDYNKAIELSQFAEAYYYRGMFLEKIFKEYQNACSDYQDALKLYPQYTEVLQVVAEFRKNHRDIACGETVVRNSNTTQMTVTNDVEMTVSKLKLPKIWAVVVGISDYKQPTINDLKYARQDAEIFYKFLKSSQGGSVPDDHIRLLTDKNATRVNIIKALDEIFNQAEAEDMVIFYTACHGQADPRTNKIYFICHDTEADALNATAVSQRDIEEIFTTTRAGKKLWLADACHSGGAGLQIRATENTFTQKLLTEIANTGDGMAIFSSSSGTEFSFEDARWGGGHGIFTHYLVEGMKGKADVNGDGKVDIREIEDYVETNVKRDTKGQQHPELKGRFDNKMPVSITK